MSEQLAFFVKIRGRTLGPFDIPRIRQMIQQGQISRINPVSTDGHQWQKAGEFNQLFQGDTNPGRAAEAKPGSEEQSASTKRSGGGAERTATAPGGNSAGASSAWYYNVGDRQEGPVSANIIRDLIRNGQLSAHDHAWREGMANWLTVAEVPELAALLPGRLTTNWLVSSGAANSGQTKSADFQETKLILGSGGSWVTFVCIASYILAAFTILGFFGAAFEAYRLQSNFHMGVAISSLLWAGIVLTGAIFLNRYGAAMQRFRISESVVDLNTGFRWIGRLWLLIGICLIITLIFLVLIVIVAMAFPDALIP